MPPVNEKKGNKDIIILVDRDSRLSVSVTHIWIGTTLIELPRKVNLPIQLLHTVIIIVLLKVLLIRRILLIHLLIRKVNPPMCLLLPL